MPSFGNASQWLGALCATALISACGGGGSDGDSSGPAPLLPTLAQDIEPAGAKVDVAGRNYFPLHEGDNWVYAKRTASSTTSTAVSRNVVGAPDATGLSTLRETDGSSVSTIQQRLTTTGLETLDPAGASVKYPAVYAALPSYTQIATPFYAAGGTRRIVRQGDLQVDIDNDGQRDFFRLEISQVFVGFESLTVAGQAIQTAHFRSAVVLTLATTKTGASTSTSTNEDAYFADGLGLVRAERSATTGTGTVTVAPYTLELVSATIGGQKFTVSGSYAEVALTHTSLVFDATRGVYFASVSSSDASHGNRIATIDPATGSVSYSSPVGSGPGAIAVSADGRVLYVGLEGSGEVLKLALPAMTELGRVRLPAPAFYGQLLPEDISVSPTSNDVVAVSMKRTNVSPRHGGVALIRGMVLQPRMTQEHTGSDRIEFDTSGGWLIGYNNETTEFGLRRVEVLADGLIERKVVTAAGGGFSVDVNAADGLAIVGNAVYSADASLALLGTIASAQNCVKLRNVAKIACRSTTNSTQLVVVDSTHFAPIDRPIYSPSGTTSTSWRLVSGRAGEVAISEPGRITIFGGASLR